MEYTLSRAHSPGSDADRSAEAAWVSASQKGDAVAFNRLVLRWERPIYNLAFRMLQDSEEAAEATQEVFLSAYRHIRRFRQDSQFSTWLYRIASNHCISRLRRRPPGVQVSLDAGMGDTGVHRELPVAESHEREYLATEIRREVLSALQLLPPEQRLVVELKFFQELTFDQIAEATQIPMSTLKSRFYTGLEALKTRLGHTLS